MLWVGVSTPSSSHILRALMTIAQGVKVPLHQQYLPRTLFRHLVSAVSDLELFGYTVLRLQGSCRAWQGTCIMRLPWHWQQQATTGFSFGAISCTSCRWWTPTGGQRIRGKLFGRNPFSFPQHAFFLSRTRVRNSQK